MKKMTVKLDDKFYDCLFELLKNKPSTELEKDHKAKYGWSDDTYQKLLAMYQSLNEAGAIVYDENASEVSNRLHMFWTKENLSDKLPEDLALRICNKVGLQFNGIERKKNGKGEFPWEIFCLVTNTPSQLQREQFNLMIDGYFFYKDLHPQV